MTIDPSDISSSAVADGTRDQIPAMTLPGDTREALAALVRDMPPSGEAQVRIQSEGVVGGVTVTVPREALDVFIQVLGQLAQGQAVKVVPTDSELTTHQAAGLLNVSRPFLIGLLDAGAIPYRRVGTHRRVRVNDLLAYKAKDDARRDEALAELTRQAQDLGLGY